MGDAVVHVLQQDAFHGFSKKEAAGWVFLSIHFGSLHQWNMPFAGLKRNFRRAGQGRRAVSPRPGHVVSMSIWKVAGHRLVN